MRRSTSSRREFKPSSSGRTTGEDNYDDASTGGLGAAAFSVEVLVDGEDGLQLWETNEMKNDWDNLGILDGFLHFARCAWQAVQVGVVVIVASAVVMWALRTLGLVS